MKAAVVMLALFSSTAWAAFDPPDTAGCKQKFDRVACRTDNNVKGVCTPQMVNTPDFSVPSPPKFTMLQTMVCVATPSVYSWKDFATGCGIALVLCVLVLLKLFRRRALIHLE